ncbi:MAG: oligoendopeptidase F, partial [Clostridia bacterium]|nr:oligoendopeptidase F [Clostridia bacterium]
MELCARKDVPAEQTWDLSLIFADEKQMWEALERVKKEVAKLVETYAGKLTTAERIVGCLDDM